MDLKGKNVAVLGAMDPGVETVKFLHQRGCKIKFYGTASEGAKSKIKGELGKIPVTLNNQEIPSGELVGNDLIILTPGGGRAFKSQIKKAVEHHAKVMTDLDLALTFYQKPIIAVTGSNGKSTTIHMLQAAFDAAGIKTLCAGGEYMPFAKSLLQPLDYSYILLELNSTRLERVSKINPFISVFLNLYPGHSERHENWHAYEEAKAKIFTDQTPDHFLIYSEPSGPINKLIKSHQCRAKLIPFGIKGPLPVGAYLDTQNKKIIYSDPEGRKSYFDYSRFGLIGRHNIDNALAVICVVKIVGLTDSSIQKMLNEIKPLHDRVEPLKVINGIRYINDAQASNPASTLCALYGFRDKSVLLIIGGQPSPHLKSRYLIDLIGRKAKKLVIFGTQRKKIYEILGSPAEAFTVANIKDALEVSLKHAEKGNSILFSPALRPEKFTHGTTINRGMEFRRLVDEIVEFNKARKVLDRI
jgi:UDP-N-acetylmuramoylalanine--D-glutamate ligase